MIRVASEQDCARLLEIYGYYVENTAVSFEYHTPTPEEFSRRIRKTLERYPYLVYEQEGQVWGYAYAGPLIERSACDWSVEVSLYVHRDMRRQGVGKTLYRELERALKMQNVINLEACVACPGEEDPYLTYDSACFHSRLGYRQVGIFRKSGYKFGRWYDLIWLEKQIAPHSDHPMPFVPFPQVRKEFENQ